MTVDIRLIHLKGEPLITQLDSKVYKQANAVSFNPGAGIFFFPSSVRKFFVYEPFIKIQQNLPLHPHTIYEYRCMRLLEHY